MVIVVLHDTWCYDALEKIVANDDEHDDKKKDFDYGTKENHAD